MIAGPVLLIALPLAAAPLVYLLRRWPWAEACLASAIALGMAGLCLFLPLDRPVSILLGRGIALGEPVSVLGRELALNPADCLLLALLYLMAATCFLFAWRVPQGRAFAPLGLIILGVLSGAVAIRHLLFAALLLWLASIVAVLMVQGDRRGSTRGALRYLVVTTLAVPPLLTLPWLIDLYALHPENLAVSYFAAVLLASGFAIVLGVVPFHVWVPSLADEAPPLATAFVLTAMGGAALFVTLSYFEACPWLVANPQVFRLLGGVGLLTAAIGGLFAFAQRDFSRLLGYAALSDMGCLLVALGQGSALGLSAALLEFVNRSLGLTLAGMGLAMVRSRAGSDAFADAGGLARRLPLATAGLLLGGLSLAGFPLTAGFVSRWALLRLLAGRAWWWVPILAGAGVAVGFLRGLSALLGPKAGPSSPPCGDCSPLSNPPHMRGGQGPLLPSAMILGLMLLCMVLGLWPQYVMVPIQRVVETFTFLR